MLSNFHTHSNLCDGKDTLEDIVKSAIEGGFSALGFSGHAYTYFDLSYCMKDTEAYVAEVLRLKEKYADKIEIFLGVEEDAYSPVQRSRFDYIIGSSHYFNINNKYMAIDSGLERFERALCEFGGDIYAMAESYYSAFCEYILRRKPDIVGHFDLITKYDEQRNYQLLSDKKYCHIAEKYAAKAAKSGCVFEINTGAISRGVRTSPYPSIELLHTFRKNGAKIILSSDSHSKDTLDCCFEKAKAMLLEAGYKTAVTLTRDGFKEYDI